MKSFPVIALVLASAWPIVSEITFAQEKKPKQSLSLSLEVAKKAIPVGAVPAIRLTIENKGDSDQKILKPRGDLQDTYFDLEVTKDGKQVDLPRAFADPGPISDQDYLNLKPGKKVSFEFTRFALVVGRLPTGKYEARIRFWQYPSKIQILSPAAAFIVEK